MEKVTLTEIAELYGCMQFVMNLQGEVFALKPEGQLKIQGLTFTCEYESTAVLSQVMAK